MNNLHTYLAEGLDKYPLCHHYSELLLMAAAKFHISQQAARKKYGLLTYREWNSILTVK